MQMDTSDEQYQNAELLMRDGVSSDSKVTEARRSHPKKQASLTV
jgi:hypothetical protein